MSGIKKYRKRNSSPTEAEEGGTEPSSKRMVAVPLQKEKDVLPAIRPSDAILTLSPSIFLKILKLLNEQHRMTSILTCIGDPRMRRLLEYANTDYTMVPCSNNACKLRKLCNCCRLGMIQIPNAKSLSIIGGPASASWSTNYTKKDVLNLPQSLTQLQLGSHESRTWIILRSNILRHIPNASNLQYLSVNCFPRKSVANPLAPFTSLKTLCIEDCAVNEMWLKHLPINLTVLSCPNEWVSAHEVASALPKTLTALNVASITLVEHLSSLIHLEIGGDHLPLPTRLPPRLEILRTGILSGSPWDTVWPSSIVEITISGYNFHSRHRYPSGLQYLNSKVMYQSLRPDWSLPFAACFTTLTTVELHLTCVFDPDYFALSWLTALVRLDLKTKYNTAERRFGEPVLRLFKLPPNIKYLNLDLDLMIPPNPEVDSNLHIVPFDLKEYCPILQHLAISNSFAAWATYALVKMHPDSFPALSTMSLRFPALDYLISRITYFNDTTSDSLFGHSDLWSHLTIEKGVLSRRKSYSSAELKMPSVVHDVPSPWQMKHSS